MPQAVRIQDICTGHSCFAPRPVVQCSTNVFIEKRGAVNTTHMWMPHTCDGDTHPGFGAGGSSSVNINGSGAMRVGDSLDCGSCCMTGASTVQLGG
jgi:uncharacterized Zn-binding protein involved in type VI secretion